MTKAGSCGRDASLIRVAHVITDWLPISENWLYWLATRTPANVETCVLSEKVHNLEQFPVEPLRVILKDGVTRLLGQLPGLRRVVRCEAYRYALRGLSPHLIHSHFGNVGWQNLPLARRLRVPHVVSFYGMDVSLPECQGAWRDRYRDMFEQVSAILCQGPHMRDRIAAQGAPKEKVRVLQLGIDIDHIPYRPRTWNGAEPLRVLMAGRFVEKKGFPYAIDALARIASQVPLEVHLVGGPSTSPASKAEAARIDAAIERGGLGDRLVRHGMIPYIALMELAYRCHVLLSPSIHASDGDSEGGAPMTLGEMAAAGMPIVSTTHCDIPYAVGGEANALLAPERDADALADRLLTLIDDTTAWRPMLDRARAYVEQSYNIDQQGLELARIYLEVIGSPKRLSTSPSPVPVH
jgi:colanic acid/amylovoran biosynthesis glycosyltransferase